AGNEKLTEAYARLKEMTLSDEAWNAAMEKWHLANNKLSLLCTHLESLGYDICLYIEDGVKARKCLNSKSSIGDCRVCPSKIHYWANELMLLPSGGDPAPKVPVPVSKAQPVLMEETQAEKDIKTLWPK
ncbi:hypothetical protein LCGC14_2810710, partial [marine sediment metagenome]